MNKNKLAILFIFFLNAFSIIKAQNPIFKLEEIVNKAQTQSPSYKLAQQRKEIAKYKFLNYKSDLKPQIYFYGNAPVYVKRFTPVTQPDGTISFESIRQNISNVGFSLNQKLPFSGGTLSLSTDLSRFDEFKTNLVRYNGTPFYIKLDQPLFAVNYYKWDRFIEPTKLEESQQFYLYELEEIAQSVTNLYFQVVETQEELIFAINNSNVTSENYSIEKRRIQLGTTTEDRLLQLELQMLKSKQKVEKAKYTYQISLLNLKSILGVGDSLNYRLELPEDIPVLEVNVEDAIFYARKYRSDFLTFKRRKLEAQRDVALAKSAKYQVNLSASFGYNRADGDIGTIYTNPQNQQLFSIGFNIPIVDWGRRETSLRTAQSIEKLIEFNNVIDEIKIVQEITTLVKNISLLKSNIELDKKTDSVAQRRYEISNNYFQIGKVSITDMNIAQSEKDDARRSYILSLKNYWEAYFLLRKLTLFDFRSGKKL